MKSIGLLLGIISPFLLIACQTTSTGDPNRRPGQLDVQARISQNYNKFSKLNSSQKKAVKRGTVSKGMKKEAVRLAWGKPDQVKKSGNKEQWIYYRSEEVVFDPQSSRTGWAQYYSSADKYYDGNFHKPFKTVRREDRTVHFEGGRVVSWTRTRY